METPMSTKPSTPLLPIDKYSLNSHEIWDLITLVENFKKLRTETLSKYGHLVEIKKLKKTEAANFEGAMA